MESEKVGGRPLHQSEFQSRGARARKKLTGKTDWFKKKQKRKLEEEEDNALESMEPSKKKSKHGGTMDGRQQEPSSTNSGFGGGKDLRTTSVMFVEQTPGGKLAKSLKEAEHRLTVLAGFKIKIQERGGTKLQQLLPNTNPWSGNSCGREDCVTCMQEGETKQNCFKRCVVYESICNICNKEDSTKDSDNKKKGWEGLVDNREFPSIYVGERDLQVNT